ncbi:hypothetical protein AB0M43_36640 [Longispora sp. NPDC051575]|uniref:hypothetical protein n=1 Tax=Longispora sp. NPDC051575 TaxID=3154943 RepID=UPI00343BF468
MASVVWVRHSGDEIEKLFAVGLSRRYGMAERIRASVGDGGLDVIVHTANGIEVWQVKGYTGNLTASRKTKIAKSLNRMLEYTRQAGITVTHWHLAIPMNPSKENREWFTKLTEGVGFPCTWQGEIWADGLMAEFPEIYTYYHDNGRSELLAAVRELTKAVDLIKLADTTDPQAVLSPREAQAGLEAIFKTLNGHDPHYSYNFRVTAEMPAPVSEKNMVFSQTVGSAGCFVTYAVCAKHPHATVDEPVTLKVVFKVKPGTPEHTAVEDFYRYGIPFGRLESCAEITAELPGGLGGEVTGGSVAVGPTDDDLATPDRVLRLRLCGPDGNMLAETRLLHRPVTYGLYGKGCSVIGRHPTGLFTIRHLSNLEANKHELRLSFSYRPGVAVAEAANAFGFLAAFTAPNTFRTAEEYGPVTMEPTEIPDLVDTAHITRYAFLARCLETIQQHTPTQILLPDADELLDNAFEIISAAAVLMGRQHTSMTAYIAVPATQAPADAEDDGPRNFQIPVPHTITLNGQTIDLGGERMLTAYDAVAETRPQADGTFLLHITPFEGPNLKVVCGPMLDEEDDDSA